MSKSIIKLNDKKTNADYYLIWSTIIDAPVSYGMAFEDCVKLYKKESNEIELLELPTLLKRLKETDSSSLLSVKELLEYNRAGKNGKKLSKIDLLQDYCLSHATYISNGG